VPSHPLDPGGEAAGGGRDSIAHCYPLRLYDASGDNWTSFWEPAWKMPNFCGREVRKIPSVPYGFSVETRMKNDVMAPLGSTSSAKAMNMSCLN
jgi:hypothetical protein